MQTIIVDMTPGFRMPTIYYSQGDVGTQFAIDLRSRFGDSFPTGTTVTIQATKPSGFGFSVAATSVTNGVATFTTTAEMTDEFGRFPAELKVTKTGLTLFTANFYMDGERNTHPEGTTDGSQETVIPELTQLVERVEDAASSVLDMTVVANTLPAGSDATYSYDEETNTATFGIPKGADGSLASGVLAPTYSSSSTYAVGDYVYYSGSLYRCTTAITTAEAWTSGHWTQVALAPEVSDLKSDLSDEETARIALAGRVTTAESDIDTLETHKIAQPLDEYNQPTDGTNGQSLRTKGDGTTEWADVGLPTDEQTENAVSAWLDDHPEATTTVVDGSLTESKFSDALILKTIKDYVTPEMFGAKGDGITDDTVSIQEALDYSATNNIKFVANNVYKTTDTITILHDAEINGLIKYAGTGLAILVGYKNTATNLVLKTIKVRVEADSFTDSTSSIGVYFGNTYNCTITIDYVSNFYNGVVFNSYGVGNAYNVVYINRIQLFKIGLTLNSDLNGWVNENVFYNGSIRQETGFIYQHDDIHILIASSRNYNNNNNRFYNQCLEGAKLAIKITYGEYNYFYNIRTEDVETVIETGNNAMLNFVNVSYGTSVGVAEGVPNYVLSPEKKAFDSLSYKLVDTGFLGKEVAYNASQGSFKNFASIDGDVQSYRIVADISDNGLVMGIGRIWCACIDLSNNKTKRIRVVADASWDGGRITYLCIDKNGNDIDQAPHYYLKNSGFTKNTSMFSGHTAYHTNGIILDGDFGIVDLPSETATLWFAIWHSNNNATWTLKSVSVYSDDKGTYKPTNESHAVLAAIPTSTGYNGQFVKAKSPTTSCIGWIYFNNTWNIVPL